MIRGLSALVCMFLASCAGNDATGQTTVYKYDGSVQCEGSGTSVEEMERELTDAGIHVVCGQKAGDGYAYPALCGTATGMINVYTIGEGDLSQAESLGFESTDKLPDYEDQECER